jgi:hypothetical protein
VNRYAAAVPILQQSRITARKSCFLAMFRCFAESLPAAIAGTFGRQLQAQRQLVLQAQYYREKRHIL